MVDPAYELLGGLATLKGATDVAYVPFGFSLAFWSVAGGAVNSFLSGPAGNAFLAPAAGNAFFPLFGLPPASIFFFGRAVLERFGAVAFLADVP